MAKYSKKALVAKKIGMTRILNSKGTMIPVTLLQVEKQKVTKVIKEPESSYSAIQVGYHVKREKI